MLHRVKRCVLLTSDVSHRVLQVTGSVTSCYTLCNVNFKRFSPLCVTGTGCSTSTARSSQLSANQNYLQPFLSVLCYRLLSMLHRNRCCATSTSDVFFSVVLQVTGYVTS